MNNSRPGHYLNDFIESCKKYFQDSEDRKELYPWNDETSAWFRRFVAYRHDIEQTTKGELVLDWITDKDHVRHEVDIADTLREFRELTPKRDKLLELLALLKKIEMKKMKKSP